MLCISGLIFVVLSNVSFQLQEKKRELTRAALSGDKLKNMRLGMDELLALFRHGGNDDED